MWKPGRWMTIISCTFFTLRLTVLLNSIKCFVILAYQFGAYILAWLFDENTYDTTCKAALIAAANRVSELVVSLDMKTQAGMCLQRCLAYTNAYAASTSLCTSDIQQTSHILSSCVQVSVLSHRARQTIGQQCQLALFHVSFESLLYKEVICLWQHLQQ